jgi:hypothetical protein
MVQLIPAGLLVTEPLPEPLPVTVSGEAPNVNEALTPVAPFIVTAQLPAPLHAPPQAPKPLPGAGATLSVTCDPCAKLAEQVPLAAPALMVQLIPAGALVTVPAPVPAPVTVKGWSTSGPKFAVTLLALSSEKKMQLPEPAQSPLQPVKLLLPLAVAVSVTAAPGA